MEVSIEDKNCYIVCEPPEEDINQLNKGSLLEVSLVRIQAGIIPRIVTLRRGRTSRKEGIRVNYIPCGGDWSDFKEAHIIINPQALRNLDLTGKIVSEDYRTEISKGRHYR